MNVSKVTGIQSLLILSFLQVVLLIICGLFLEIRFSTIDDIYMLLMASGAYTGEPNSQLYFINTLYSSFVTLQYTYIPNLEWYTINFVLFNLVSYTYLQYRLLQVLGNNITSYISILLLFSIELYCLLFLQFTTTSAVLCFTGITLLSNKDWTSYVFSIFAIYLAMSIRFESAALVALMSSPYVFYQRTDFKSTTSFLTYFISTAGILFLYYFLEISFIQPKTTVFDQYIELLGIINENPAFQHFINSNNVETISGISKEGYHLFLSFFTDRNIFSISNLEILVNYFYDNHFIDSILFNINNNLFYFRYEMALISIAFIYLSVKYENKFYLLLCIATYWFLFLLISSSYTFKFRVFITVILPLIYFLPKLFYNQKILALNLFLLLFCCLFIFRTYQNYNRFEQTEPLFEDQQQLINHIDQLYDIPIIPFTGSYNIETVSAFNISNSFNTNVFFSGWLIGLPSNKTPDNFFDYVDDYSILIHERNSHIKKYLVNVLLEFYNIEVNATTIGKSEFHEIFLLETKL